MAHFARIQNGTVLEVIVVNDADAPDEATGQAFIAAIGLDGEWVQTSYTASMRGKYAGIGDVWDGTDFLAPDPAPVAAAYERGKADGAAELLAMQASVTESS
jgi:hypothetical protein